jgi:hypothetical protein
VTARMRLILIYVIWLTPTVATYFLVNQPRYVALSMALGVLGATAQIRGFVNAIVFLKERKKSLRKRKNSN